MDAVLKNEEFTPIRTALRPDPHGYCRQPFSSKTISSLAPLILSTSSSLNQNRISIGETVVCPEWHLLNKKLF